MHMISSDHTDEGTNSFSTKPPLINFSLIKYDGGENQEGRPRLEAYHMMRMGLGQSAPLLESSAPLELVTKFETKSL